MNVMSSLYSLFLYLCCCGVVVLYLNTFVLWAWIRGYFGPVANYFPAIITGVLIVLIGLCFSIKPRRKRIQKSNGWLIFSIILTIMAFFLPDPHFPVKKIHVVQYFLLACLVRYPLSLRLCGSSLSCYTFLLTLTFGVHDELLQGLHPLRTFGLRDMLVNGSAALAGTLFTHFIGLYEGKDAYLHNTERTRPGTGDVTALTTIAGIFFLLSISVLCYLLPLPFYRNSLIPYWLAAPLVGTLAACVLFLPKNWRQRNHHGLVVLFWMLFFLPAYSIIANVSPIQFN